MQDVEQSVDIEEVQVITDGNSYDDIDFDFLPREHISRYTKLFVNFDVNVFERSESEPEQSTDNDSDDS
ncbi:11454_t:CDS:1, partial [Funneliformis caledonium]